MKCLDSKCCFKVILGIVLAHFITLFSVVMFLRWFCDMTTDEPTCVLTFYFAMLLMMPYMFVLHTIDNILHFILRVYQ
jgi:hypothetical protein